MKLLPRAKKLWLAYPALAAASFRVCAGCKVGGPTCGVEYPALCVGRRAQLPGADVAAASPVPRADVAATSPSPVQMWQRQAQSQVQMWQWRAQSPVQMRDGVRAFRHRCGEQSRHRRGSAVRVKQIGLPSTCCYLCPMSRTYTRCCRSKPEKESTGLKTNKRANERGARSSS